MRIETTTFNEKRELILLAEKYIKSGANTSTIKNKDVKNMMKKIAANAVCIGLYNFNRFVISHIGDGDFATIKHEWKDLIEGITKCGEIITNEGEYLVTTLSLKEIEDAVRFSIFELEGSEEDE